MIVLGMHRSGTGLMTQMLERSGVFMGEEQEVNHEAIFFLKLNEWMFWHLNTTWDEPRNAGFLDEVVAENLAQALEIKLGGDERIKYLGQSKTPLYKNLISLDFPWGWKDPRNVWTASIWLRLFPEAKVINIHRHPVDVAASLRYREIKYAEEVKEAIAKIGLPEFLKRGYRFQVSGRVKLLQEGFNLWEQYVSQALSLEQAFPNNFLTVSYEALLDYPEETMSKIDAHLGIQGAVQRKASDTGLIKTKRRFAFLDNPELSEFHQTILMNPLIKKLGYT